MAEELDKRLSGLLSELGDNKLHPCRSPGKNGEACIQQHERVKGGKVHFWFDLDCGAARRLCDNCKAYFCIAVARNALLFDAKTEAILQAELARKRADSTDPTEDTKP